MQGLRHEVNCLTDVNRGARKCALEKISKQTSTISSPADIHGLLGFLLKPLLKVFSDPVEKCRELSIRFITE